MVIKSLVCRNRKTFYIFKCRRIDGSIMGGGTNIELSSGENNIEFICVLSPISDLLRDMPVYYFLN